MIRLYRYAVRDTRTHESHAHADCPDGSGKLRLDVPGTARATIAMDVDHLPIFVDTTPDRARIRTSRARGVLHSLWFLDVVVVFDYLYVNTFVLILNPRFLEFWVIKPQIDHFGGHGILHLHKPNFCVTIKSLNRDIAHFFLQSHSKVLVLRCCWAKAYLVRNQEAHLVWAFDGGVGHLFIDLAGLLR